MAFGFLDIFGGSQRRAALQLLDRTLGQLEVNPAYVDDGMRYAMYKWALDDGGDVDRTMQDAAALISFCVLGAAETEAIWGAAVRQAREARFDAVLANNEDETFDARVIKLILAKGVAAADIRGKAMLE
jgi:hypothetical protein